MFGTTLDTVEVVIEVKKGDAERDSADDHTLVLTRGEGIDRDGSDKYHLNDGELGHHETLLHSIDFLSRFGGVLFHTLSAVSGHFYFIQRK